MNITILTGAGISAESGIGTFRDANGLWENHSIMDVATPEGFERDPELVHEFYNQRRRELLGTNMVPNDAHKALTRLQNNDTHQVTIITQNVDNLDRIAGVKNITEIHGNLFWIRCIHCGSRYPREEISLEVLPPHCPRCNGIMKTDGVMFGEPIPSDVLEKCQGESAIHGGGYFDIA